MQILRLKKAGALAFLILVISAGAYARFTELSWHFSHTDDLGVAKTILDMEVSGFRNPLTSVPERWTYAPFQFLITPFLVDPQQTYREILFRGRLPSAVFGTLSAVFLALFYLLFSGRRIGRMVLAVAITALSLENIIHAKQMHPYALGAAAAVLVLILLIYLLRRPSLSFAGMLGAGVLLAVCSTMQYQILFFAPAFFFVLFVHAVMTREHVIPQLRNLIAGGLFYGLLYYPIWIFFLKRHEKAGLSWNRGPQAEFLFSFPEGGSWISGAIYAAGFYLHNFLLILQSNLAFVPETHPLFIPVVYYLFGILFFLGVISYVDTADRLPRLLGLFFAAAALTWAVLVFMGKITLSPTRHSLILLPFLAVTVSEGLHYLFEKTGRLGSHRLYRAAQSGTPYLLSAFMLIFFLGSFGGFLKERRDPFIERDIVSVLKTYQVDGLVRAGHTLQPTLMREVQNYFHDYEFGWMEHGFMGYAQRPLKTVSWISHRTPLTASSFGKIQEAVNGYLFLRNNVLPKPGDGHFRYLQGSFEDYEIIYSVERPSHTEIDFSARTENGPNSFYFYVLRSKERAG